MGFWKVDTTDAVAFAADRAALKALNTSKHQSAFLADDGGTFRRSNDDLSATLTNLSVTSTSIASSVITKTAHGLLTGQAVIATTAVNGLTIETVYYAIALTADTFKLASSFLDARAGTAMTLTDTTNFTVRRLVDPLQGIYVVATGHSLDGSNGCWTREFSGPANVKWFGAVGDFSNDDTQSLQAATDLCGSVYVPDGQYKITRTWLLDDAREIRFASRDAIIRTSLNIDMMAGRGTSGYCHTPYRNFQVILRGGTFTGPAKDNGQAAMNWESFSFVKVFGTGINYIQYAIKNGGPSSLGAFYNDFFGVDISTCNLAVSNGTLGNHINFFGGRANDLSVGTDDYDNSDNSYWGFAIETYTTCGSRVSYTGQASQRIRFMGCRYENAAVTTQTGGIVVHAAAQNTVVLAPQYIGAGAVDLSDSGTSTVTVAPYI